MSHHFSWYKFLPIYNMLNDYFQNNYSYTVIFNYGLMPQDKIFETMDHIFSAITVVIVLFFISLNVYIKLKNVQKYVIPSKGITLINIIDIFYEYLLSFMENIIENNSKKHINFVGTLALFILFSNVLGLIPGFTSSTNNLNTTIACGFVVFFYFNYHGLMVNGLKHFGHLANPLNVWWGWFLSPFFFPLEFVGILIRPISLGMRLAGNLMGDHSVIMAFTGVMPFLLPLPFLFFGLMVCAVQTFVFVLLTCIYIHIHTIDTH